MIHRTTAATLLGAAAALTLSGCPGSTDDDAGKEKRPPVRQTPAIPPGWRSLGGQATEMTISVPGDWTPIDLKAEDLAAAARQADIPGANKEVLSRGLLSLRAHRAVYAYDGAAKKDTGFATNLNGFCLWGPSSVTGLKREVRRGLAPAGVTGVQVRDTVIGERPAIEVSYGLTYNGTRLKGLQVQVPDGRGQYCVASITAKKDAATPEAEDILGTLRLWNWRSRSQ